MSNNALGKKNKYNMMTIVCMIAFFLSNISYLPFFTENGLTQYLSYPAWALIIGMVFLYKQWYLSSRDVKFGVILLIAIVFMGTAQGLANKNYFSSLLTKCFFLVMIIMLVGGMIARTGKTWGKENLLFYSYIAATAIVCIVVFTQYLMGQDLNSRFYSYKSKNEAAFLAVSAIVMLLAMPEPKQNKKIAFLVRAALIAFFAYVTTVMRCRSMLLALAVVVLIFLCARSTTKRMRILLALGIIALVIALTDDGLYDNFVNNIVLSGREQGNIDDISSGRVHQMGRGWKLFQQNIFLGTGDTATVDCFYISALMQYGLFMGGGLIVLGVYPFVWGILNYRKIKSPICMIMIVCALVYLIGGVFEENAPFGPGVRCYISWFLFGYLRVQQIHGCFEGDNYEENRAA